MNRDFGQQPLVERQQRLEVCCHTAVAKNVKITKQRLTGQRNAAFIDIQKNVI